MSRTLTTSVENALDDEVFKPFFAVELLFDSPNELRLWTGQGELTYDSNTWYGTGTMLTLDAIEETSETAAKGANLTLSGVPSEVISLALSEPYQGRVCKVYLGVVTDTVNLTEIFSGYMDMMNIEEGAGASTISLAVENKLIDLERKRVARYTSAYQKSIYPNDKGLDFVEDLQDKEIVWGRKAG